MRFRFFIILLVSLFSGIFSLHAQHSFGIKGGMGAGNVRFSPVRETAFYIATPNFGVAYRYYGGDQYVGGVEVGLNYQVKGYKEFPRMDSDTTYIRTVTQIQLPFLWQPHIEMFHNKARLIINAGPYVAYNLSSNEKYITKELGTVYDREYVFDSARDNRLEYGLQGGIGYGISIVKHLELVADCRYVFAMSDLLKNKTKYSDNPTNSPFDYVAVSLGLYFHFGGF